MKKPPLLTQWFILLWIILCSFTHGTDGNDAAVTDSLSRLIKSSKSDTAYIRLNYAMAKEFFYCIPDSAKKCIHKAMERAHSTGDRRSYAQGLNYLGNLCVQEAHFLTALEYFQQCLNIALETGDKKYQANATNNIGIIYTELENYEEAIDNYKESFRLNTELGNWQNASYSLYNIAGDYLELNQTEKAREYYVQMNELNNTHPEAWDGQLILGEIYLKENKIDSAITSFRTSLRTLDELGDSYMLAATKVSLAKSYIRNEQYDQATHQLNASEAICVQNDYNDLYLDVLKERSNLLQAQGMFAEALSNQLKYISIKDSLDQLNRFNRISELNAKYEKEKRESEISKQQQQIQNKNSLIIISMIGLGALIVITILILYNLLRKRKLNAILKNQNSQIRLQRQKIIASLKYAKKIQRSFLVPEKVMKDVLPESFIFFKPKDIVSGDFYWFKRLGKKMIIATVDCTGHGVPGAFLSLIANSQLEKAVSEKCLSDPGDIMKYVHEQILVLLNQDNRSQSAQDGLDITICLIDTHSNTLRFAGSGNAIYLVKDNQIQEIKTENFGLAGDFFARKSDPLRAFSSQEIQYLPGTDLFMLTDGYLDQFGGRENKKLNKPRFRELLKNLSKTNLQNAHHKCEQFFESWKGGLPQLDDVLVIGARL